MRFKKTPKTSVDPTGTRRNVQSRGKSGSLTIKPRDEMLQTFQAKAS
jgi:hypothetical protein